MKETAKFMKISNEKFNELEKYSRQMKHMRNVFSDKCIVFQCVELRVMKSA